MQVFFVDVNKLILKFIWKVNRPRRANAILKKNIFKTHYPISKLIINYRYQWCAFCERTETQVSGIE